MPPLCDRLTEQLGLPGTVEKTSASQGRRRRYRGTVLRTAIVHGNMLKRPSGYSPATSETVRLPDIAELDELEDRARELASRWKSASVMRGYVEEGNIWNDNAAARLGL